MPLKWGDDAVAGSFEELPTLLVVLVAVSLFSVSVAHAANSWGGDDDYLNLREDCLAFAELVRSSDTLCSQGRPGVFAMEKLQNLSEADFLEEFSPDSLGFEYRVGIQCLDPETGAVTLTTLAEASEMPQGVQAASFTTCANVDDHGSMGAARLTVTIWRPVP